LICPADIGVITEPDRSGQKDYCEFGLNLLNAIPAELPAVTAIAFDEWICFRVVQVLSYGVQKERMSEPSEIMLRIPCVSGDCLKTGLDSHFMARVSHENAQVIEKLWIQTLPKFMFIQVERNCLVNGKTGKDCRYFAFDIELDLSSYLEFPIEGAQYVLFGVVAHIGMPEVGVCHYVAFCKIENEWICFNDSSVEVVGERQAIQENFPENNSSNRTAVLLIYTARSA
jgi:hypothetical protein